MSFIRVECKILKTKTKVNKEIFRVRKYFYIIPLNYSEGVNNKYNYLGVIRKYDLNILDMKCLEDYLYEDIKIGEFTILKDYILISNKLDEYKDKIGYYCNLSDYHLKGETLLVNNIDKLFKELIDFVEEDYNL